MNKACENVPFFDDFLDNDTIYNTSMGKRLSSLIVGDGKNKYITPNKEMYRDLQIFSDRPIFSTQAAVLRVTLKLEKHDVWRRVVVPLNRTFGKLHQFLQIAFGWEDYHLHEFYIYDHSVERKPIIKLVCHEEAFAYPAGVEMKLEKGVKLSEYIPEYKNLNYNYDFGDGWEHEIVVERMIDDYDVNYPVCLEGEGNTPPEDVGGEGGYDMFLEIIANENHPDYKHMVERGRMQGYGAFDLEQVNRELKYDK